MEDHEAVDAGRLFQIKLRHSAAARARAKATIRLLPNGKWCARIGGRVRGVTVSNFFTQADAERAVDDYYNEAMLAWVKQQATRAGAAPS